MSIKNTVQEYGAVAKLFHWVMGILIMAMLALGIYMSDLENSPQKFELYALHKATGIMLLFTLFLRVIWRIKNIQPDMPHNMPPMQKLLAKFLHLNLYFLIFLIPLSGWMLSSSAGYPVSIYGLFEMPNIIDKSKQIADISDLLHGVFAYILIALLVVHISAAFRHHFVVKDDTLKKMLPKI